MKKLWDKGQSLDADIEAFTIGQDRVLDLRLAPYDVLASKAHAQMLCSMGLLSTEEWQQLEPAFDALYQEVQQVDFCLDEGVEDIHSQLEGMLTARLGEVGKKIHSGRSRNDQVLVALALYYRDAVQHLRQSLKALIGSLLDVPKSTKATSCQVIRTCKPPCHRHSPNGLPVMPKTCSTIWSKAPVCCST